MTIVAAVDRLPDARPILEEADRLAHAFGSPLHVLHVHGQYESTEQIRHEAARQSGKPIDVEQGAEVAVERARELAAPIVERFTPVGRTGFPAREIVHYATDVDATFVVVGGRKRSPVGKVLFGSVTQSVLLGADRPVVTVRLPEGESEDTNSAG